MKTNNKETYLSSRCLIIATGTTAIGVGQGNRTQELSDGVPIENRVRIVGLDAIGVSQESFIPTVEKDLEYVNLLPGEVIGEVIPEKESRKILFQAGKLDMVTEDWVSDPDIVSQNPGTNGNIRKGSVQHACNANTVADKICSNLRDINNYEKQRLGSSGDAKGQTIQPLVDGFVVASLVGGKGSSSFRPIIQTTRRVASELHMNIRITPILLLRGTLNPGDVVAAACNQYWSLKSLQLFYEGKLHLPNQTNGDQSYFCEPPIILSNANDHGELAHLLQLKALTSKFLNLICHKQFGKIFRQESSNLYENQVTDGLGRFRKAATFGISLINLNKLKALFFTAVCQVLLFVKRLLLDEKSAEPVERAYNCASELSLTETYTDDSACNRLCLLTNTGNIDVRNRVISVLHQRWNRRRGFDGCTQLYAVGRYIFETEVPQLVLAMQSGVPRWMKDCQTAFKRNVSDYLQKLTGLPDSRRYLESLLELIKKSEAVNQDKLQQAYGTSKALRAALNSYEQKYLKLKSKNWLYRLFSFFIKASFLKNYPRYVEATAKNMLEIDVRKMLAANVYPAVRQMIMDELNYINCLFKNTTTLCTALEGETHRLGRLSDDFYVPCGIELANQEFMERVLRDIYKNNGGKSSVISKMFEAFCSRYKSLDVFSNGNIEEIEKFLIAQGQQNAQQTISALNVMEVFKSTFPQPEQQNNQFFHNINESCGRIRLIGEADEDIPALKYILAHDQYTADYVAAIANSINRRGGDWRPVIVEGLDSIIFMWYRARVSISQLIEETGELYQPPKDPRKLAKLGEHPLISFAPVYGCGAHKIDTIIAAGLLAGYISHDKNKYGFCCNGHRKDLGSSLDEIRATLAEDYPLLVAIYADSITELSRRAKQGQRTDNATNTKSALTDPLVQSLSPNTFTAVESIAEELAKYLR